MRVFLNYEIDKKKYIKSLSLSLSLYIIPIMRRSDDSALSLKIKI